MRRPSSLRSELRTEEVSSLSHPEVEFPHASWLMNLTLLLTLRYKGVSPFAGYFPRGSIERVREWIWTWAGFYNLSKCYLTRCASFGSPPIRCS